ncbi:EFR1 family ferrodoxin [candidate division CSSED10-310 bacterium]|uniref:EFR1 family ferrodoxin n=1 Tax=candidate division CSSED10-310 bacterium TaxID=2855610 RepID=A0ABV6Z489_UNCC1
MNKALIIYYTCSGNTREMANITAKILRESDWEVRVYNLRTYKPERISFEPQLLIVGVPVHYWEMPDAAVKMIRDLPQFKNTAGFVFSTFGKCVCNSVPFQLAQELQAKGVNVLGGAQIVMPHSSRLDEHTRIGDIEPSFGQGEPSADIVRQYGIALRDITHKINEGPVAALDVTKLKALHTRNAVANVMNVFMTTGMRRDFMPYVQRNVEKCIQCKKCVSHCDYQALKLSGQKEFSLLKKRCKKCYTCIEVCKQNALYTNWKQVIFWTRFIHPFSKNTDTIVIQ